MPPPNLRDVAGGKLVKADTPLEPNERALRSLTMALKRIGANIDDETLTWWATLIRHWPTY